MSIIYMESKRISVGDIVTVKRWKSFFDRSYVGDLLEVLSVDSPFLCVKRVGRSVVDRPLILSTDEVEIKKLSKEFVESALGASHG